MLKPYITERNRWMLEAAPNIQGYRFFHPWGMNRSAREVFRGHPHFDYKAEFCALFDQTSFEREDTMPPDPFAPMVTRVLAADRLRCLL